MAYVLATNPESFEVIYKNNINLFHGTKANALPSILKYGINSVNESTKSGIQVSTGEEWSRIGEKRDFISFTDDLSVAEYYASMSPSKVIQGEEPFEVILGISPDSLNKLKICTVNSGLPEIGIIDNVPIESIEMIAVPKSKVEFVRRLTEGKKINVVSMDFDDKFYYFDDLGFIYIVQEELEKFRQNKVLNEKTFNTEEITKMVKGRENSGILKVFNKLKTTLKGVLKSLERD